MNPLLDLHQKLNRATAGFMLHTLRGEACRKYAWAVPTDEALDEIAKYAPIIEVGAGTGYWASLLREKGVDILAYDAFVPGKDRNEYGHSHTHTEVLKADSTIAWMYPDRALFLCWPPYDDPMATKALKVYRGSTVIYIGEGRRGCTGDEEFHKTLDLEWEEAERIYLPQWDGIHDYLTIHVRRAVVEEPE